MPTPVLARGERAKKGRLNPIAQGARQELKSWVGGGKGPRVVSEVVGQQGGAPPPHP